ncbi:hypothetical protein JDW15_03155 [Aerococcaceae bacterium zg-ZJ1578]|uniref:hypothetical protein n=1 Tax=Aerococcaceae bacterium zg-252 TaxID=2796928 RepID=UPI001A244658|nr:hypothetical protein [Aerococcaceae bacterium zg-1578]
MWCKQIASKSKFIFSTLLSILIVFALASKLLAQAETVEGNTTIETTVEQLTEQSMGTTVETVTENVTQTEEYWDIPERNRYEEIIDYNEDATLIPGPPGRLDDSTIKSDEIAENTVVTTVEKPITQQDAAQYSAITQPRQPKRNINVENIAQHYLPHFYHQQRFVGIVLTQVIFRQSIMFEIYDVSWSVIGRMLQ